jgi:hypothetical protein
LVERAAWAARGRTGCGLGVRAWRGPHAHAVKGVLHGAEDLDTSMAPAPTPWPPAERISTADSTAFDCALGRALRQAQAVDERAHEEARTEQIVVGGSLGLALWELGCVEAARLTEVGAAVAGLPGASRSEVERGAAELRELLPAQWLQEAGVLPFRREARELAVATCWPWRLDRLDELSFRTGLRVRPYYLSEVELMQALARVHHVGVPRRYLARSAGLSPPRSVTPSRPGTAAPANARELITEEEFLSLYAGAADSSPTASAAGVSGGASVPEGEIVLTDFAEAATGLEPLGSRAAAVRALADAWDRRALGEALVRFGRSQAARVVLFACRGSVWLGWTGAGDGIDGSRIGDLMVPTAPGTAFGLVHATGSPYVGPLARHPLHASFLRALGGREPASVGLFPIRHRGRPLFVIYLDGGHGRPITPDVSEMLLVAQRVPGALERMVAPRP